MAADPVGSFEVGVGDTAFAELAGSEQLVAAALLPEDDFIRPLLHSIAERLAPYPLDPSPAAPARLHLGIIEHPETNALAHWSNRVGYLAVHSGQLLSAAEAAIQLQDALGAFSQDLQPADGQGDPALTTPLGVTSFLNHLRGAGDDLNLFHERKDANDPATRRATLFIATCIQFAFLHDFGHVVNPHLA